METCGVTVEVAIEFLNELVKLDRGAIARLIDRRVCCNDALAGHPTVQVGFSSVGPVVGLLGILNGLFGIREDSYGHITALLEEDVLIEFIKTGEHREAGASLKLSNTILGKIKETWRLWQA